MNQPSTSLEDAAARLRSFVTSSLRNPDLGDDDDIFEQGDASSLFAMELVLFFEQELGVPMTDDDLEQQNFSSIRSLTDLLDAKLRAGLG